MNLSKEFDLNDSIKLANKSGRLWLNSRRRISARIVIKGSKGVARFFWRLSIFGIAKTVDGWLENNRSLFKKSSEKLLLDSLRSGRFDCFIDLGAHVGEQTFLAAEYLPVFAFEPDPFAFSRLQSLRDETTSKFDVNLFNSAAAEYDGFADLFLHKRGPTNTGSSSLERRKNNVGKEKVIVKTIDIGEYLRSIPFHSILLKCDIEGAEYRVFRSLARNRVFPKISLMLTEFHDPKIPRQWIQSLRLTFWERHMYGIHKHHLLEWL